jgi:hypothetical protein
MTPDQIAHGLLQAAWQQVYASWAGSIANFAVVATTVWIATASWTDARRLRKELELQKLITARDRIELVLITLENFFRAVDELKPDGAVNPKELRVGIVPAMAATESAVTGEIPDRWLHGMASALNTNVRAVAAVLDLLSDRTGTISRREFDDGVAGLRPHIEDARPSFNRWVADTFGDDKFGGPHTSLRTR